MIAIVNQYGTVSSKFVKPKALSRTDSLAEELGMLITKARRMVWTNATRRLDESGESMLAWQVLAFLVRTGKRNQTEVSVALAQHPAGVSRLLDDLEKQGYVARTRDVVDRRRVCVDATARGRRQYRSILPEVLLGVERALDPLSDAERRTLREILLKVVSQDPEYRSAIQHGLRQR